MVIVMVKLAVMFMQFYTYKIMRHFSIKISLSRVLGFTTTKSSFGLSQSDLICEVAILLRWSCGEVKLCNEVS